MAQLLSVSIDLAKIEKSKIIEGKNGGKYLNLTVSVNDEDDQFGNNISVWHSQSKEEREAKDNRLFLGNGKKLWDGAGSQSSKPAPKKAAAVVHDDLPF